MIKNMLLINCLDMYYETPVSMKAFTGQYHEVF